MNDVAVITLTSDRPLAFQLCERWMTRALANYGRTVHWYVVDDGLESANCTMDQTHLRRPPCDSPADSFLGNLAAALQAVQEEKILFVEDDDWYASDYLAVYSEWLDRAEIVGEGYAKYYSLPGRRYMVYPNNEHASLCQTAIRKCLVRWLMRYVTRTRNPFVDIELWQSGAARQTRQLARESRRCVGMKGLPGKVGLSDGHDGAPALALADPEGEVLRSWIGPDDAEFYFQLSTSARASR